MKFINEEVDKYLDVRSKTTYEYKSKNSGGNFNLIFSKKVFRESGYTDGVFVKFVRLYIEGSGAFEVKEVLVHKYEKVFKKMNLLENINPTLPISVNVENGAFIDVPVEVLDETFEIVVSGTDDMKVYATINGTIDNINKEILEKYNKEQA